MQDPKSGKELCGFTNRMGSNAPAPRLLRLKPGAWRGHGHVRQACQTAGSAGSAGARTLGRAPRSRILIADLAPRSKRPDCPPPPSPALPPPPLEDVKLTKNAPLEKGHFTWITEQGRQERWIVASCGNYTVLWNFRCVIRWSPSLVGRGAKRRWAQWWCAGVTNADGAATSWHHQFSKLRAHVSPGPSPLEASVDHPLHLPPPPALFCAPPSVPAGLSRWPTRRWCRTAA